MLEDLNMPHFQGKICRRYQLYLRANPNISASLHASAEIHLRSNAKKRDKMWSQFKLRHKASRPVKNGPRKPVKWRDRSRNGFLIHPKFSIYLAIWPVFSFYLESIFTGHHVRRCQIWIGICDSLWYFFANPWFLGWSTRIRSATLMWFQNKIHT